MPEVYKLEWALSSKHYAVASEEKRKGTSAEKINEILKSRFGEMESKRAKLVQAYIEAKKPAFIYNPDYDLASIPRLRLESWEVEGPIVEWPPKGRTELFFAGEERPIDASYIRKSSPAFCRGRIAGLSSRRKSTWWCRSCSRPRKTYKLSGIDAVKEGVKAVLCSPGFLMIQEPTGDANKPQPLTDYELASRLSYFLWSTMPDEQLDHTCRQQQAARAEDPGGPGPADDRRPQGHGPDQQFCRAMAAGSRFRQDDDRSLPVQVLHRRPAKIGMAGALRILQGNPATTSPSSIFWTAISW